MTNSRTLRRLAPVSAGLALALALSLTACAAPAQPAADPGATAPTTAAATDGNAAGTLPEGFPTTDVPLIDGTILFAAHPGKTWAVWIASTDLPGDLAKATALLVAAGYENVIALPDYGDFHGSKYQVHVTAKVDPKYGSSLLYSFYEVQ